MSRQHTHHTGNGGKRTGSCGNLPGSCPRPRVLKYSILVQERKVSVYQDCREIQHLLTDPEIFTHFSSTTMVGLEWIGSVLPDPHGLEGWLGLEQSCSASPIFNHSLEYAAARGLPGSTALEHSRGLTCPPSLFLFDPFYPSLDWLLGLRRRRRTITGWHPYQTRPCDVGLPPATGVTRRCMMLSSI